MTFIEHTKRRRRREGKTHSPVLSARGIGRRHCVRVSCAEFHFESVVRVHVHVHVHLPSRQDAQAFRVDKAPVLGGPKVGCVERVKRPERVVCTVNNNAKSEKLYKVCAKCMYMFTCTPVQFSSDFSYFKVPPRAHPSAGSPSGSAALDLT